jgi:hypothetical protein
MDHRAVRLALGLTIAGASLLAAGVAIWLVTDVGRVASGLAARDLRLAALALLAGGAACGLAMGFVLTTAGRARGASPGVPAGTAGLTGKVPGFTGPVPSLSEPRSLMNPPPPGPPPPPPWRLAPSRLAGAPGGQAEGEEAAGEEAAGEEAEGEPPSGDQEPAARVWWRAPNSPSGSWDDTSEEWLRSLRGPAIQQPPPHSAE